MKKLPFAIMLLVLIVVNYQLYRPDEEEKASLSLENMVSEETKGPVLEENGEALKVGFLLNNTTRESMLFYQELVEHLEEELGFKFSPVVRPGLAELEQNFQANELDLAFLPTFAFVQLDEITELQVLAAPEMNMSQDSFSVIITKKDSGIEDFSGLEDKIFAFTDRSSAAGYLYPMYRLKIMGYDLNYFKHHLFTYSNYNSLERILEGRVDGAAVNVHYLASKAGQVEDLFSKIKIIDRSPSYGTHPAVASENLSPQLASELQEFLLSLHLSDEGKRIFDDYRIDRFYLPDEGAYEYVRKMAEHVVEKNEGGE